MKPSRLFTQIVWCFLVPFFLLAIVYRPRLDGYLNPYDEGLWLGAAQALREGKQLYTGVFFHYGPLLGLWLKGLVIRGEPTLTSIRGGIWVMNAIGLLCIYGCLLKWVRSPVLRLLYAAFLGVVPLSAPIPAIPMAARYGAGFIPFLFWPNEEEQDRAPNWRYVFSGAGIAVAFFMTQEAGVAAALATGAYFGFGAGEARKRYGVLAGCAGGFGLGLAYFLMTKSLNGYVNCAFFETTRIALQKQVGWPPLFTGGTRPAGPWFIPWQQKTDALSLYAPAMTYAVIFSRRFRIYSLSTRDRLILSLALYGTASSVIAWLHSDRWHIYFALSPALLLWAALADRAQDSKKRWAVGAAIVGGALLTLPHYAARLAKDRALALFSRPTRIERAGHCRLPDRQAAGYEFLVAWIQSHTSRGDSFLFYPYDGTIYFLADRPNPSFYPVLALAATPAMQQRVLRDITDHPPVWVIWDRENNAFLGTPIEKFMGPIHRAILSRFKPYAEAGPFLFMKYDKNHG